MMKAINLFAADLRQRNAAKALQCAIRENAKARELKWATLRAESTKEPRNDPNAISS